MLNRWFSVVLLPIFTYQLLCFSKKDFSMTIISKIVSEAKNAALVFNYLESNPIIEIRKTAETLGITFNTTSSAVNRLVDAGILVQTSNISRNRTFACESYLDILRKGT